MIKKLLILLALVLFAFSTAQAKTLIYGGGEILLRGGDTDGIGAGTLIGIGQEISPELIFWGNGIAQKTNEGDQFDKALVGFSILTEPMIKPLRGGLFLNVEGGFSKVNDEKVRFGSLTSAGFYFNLSDETRFWTGGGYGNGIYSIHLGLSMEMSWR